MFGSVCLVFLNIFFIQQECIKLIKRDVNTLITFKISISNKLFWTFYWKRNLQKNVLWFPEKYV